MCAAKNSNEGLGYEKDSTGITNNYIAWFGCRV